MRLFITQLFFGISWLNWFSSIAGIIFGLWHILTQEELKALPIAGESWFSYLPLMILAVAVIEILITVALKKYVLVVPSQKHKYDSNDYLGALLFFIVHFFNYFLASSIAIYGIVLYVFTVDFVYLTSGFCIWMGLMIYHLPFKIHKPPIRVA